jgi:hypothetical protein
VEDDPLPQSAEWAQLRADDPAVRLAAIAGVLASLDARPEVREIARDVMLLALGDPDEAVRCAAVRALYALGPVELLVTTLRAPDPRTRRVALQVLQRCDVEQSSAIRTAVQGAINDPDRIVAARAFELVDGARLLDDHESRAQLIAAINHPSQRVCADAIRTTMRTFRCLDVADADVLRALRRALRRRASRGLALTALSVVAPRAVSPGLVDDIVVGLTSTRSVRATAATLAALGPRARRAVPAIAAAYHAQGRLDPDDGFALAYAALRLDRAAPWIVDACARALERSRTMLPASEVLDVLAWIGPDGAAAEPAVTALVEKLARDREDVEAIERAVGALVAIAPESPRTHAVRDRALAKFPALGPRQAARDLAFASHGADTGQRGARVVQWSLTAQAYVSTRLVDLALDAVAAAGDPALVAALQTAPRDGEHWNWMMPDADGDLVNWVDVRLSEIAVRVTLRR